MQRFLYQYRSILCTNIGRYWNNVHVGLLVLVDTGTFIVSIISVVHYDDPISQENERLNLTNIITRELDSGIETRMPFYGYQFILHPRYEIKRIFSG